MRKNGYGKPAQAFNDNDTLVNGTNRILVNVITISDLTVWNGNPNWNLNDHPDGWIPASTASLNLIPTNMPFQIIQDSTARTPLVWGGFSSRVNVLTENGTNPLDWDAVAQGAEAESWSALGGDTNWQFIKLAFNRPSNSMAGIGVLLSGAGEFFDTTTPTRDEFNDGDFDGWLTPILDSVPNYQTLGSNPAQTMAGRGTSVAEIALLPEVQWLNSLGDFDQDDALIFSYPQTQFVLDFPVAVWDDIETDEIKRLGVEAFANWLVNGESQGMTTRFGLRPVDGEPTERDTLFASGVPFGIVLEPSYGQVVDVPSRNDLEGLLQRFD